MSWKQWGFGGGALIGLVVLCALTWFDFQAAWVMPWSRRLVFYQLVLYWFSWVLWPLIWGLVWLGLRCWRWPWRLGLICMALVGCGAMIWARFVEPNLLDVHETALSSHCGVRVALISDVHMGAFGREHDLRRLVDRLNGLQVDAVLVAGDWTADPPRDLARVFAPLAQLKHPMYSVTGNHDEQNPGPPLTQSLRTALAAVGVHNIEGRRASLGTCELVGLGDLRAGSVATHLKWLERTPTSMLPHQRVVLTHEPETARLLPGIYAKWVLAGHTHGGQVNLPWLTTRILRRYHFRQGLYQLPTTGLFVTSGVGMSGMPFRFGVAPVIDVLVL